MYPMSPPPRFNPYGHILVGGAVPQADLKETRHESFLTRPGKVNNYLGKKKHSKRLEHMMMIWDENISAFTMTLSLYLLSCSFFKVATIY